MKWNKTQKGIALALLSIMVVVLVYGSAYLYLREAKTFSQNRQGAWVVYLYGESFVRQYALDEPARRLFAHAVKMGDRSFYAGFEGENGPGWFCVYREPGARIYRVFRLAELVENRVRFSGMNTAPG